MKDAIRRNFDDSVVTYTEFEAATGQFETLATRLLAVVDERLAEPPARAVDAGAGTGASTRRLDAIAETVLAVDLSREMLRENGATHRLQADFDALPLVTDSVDAVVFTASLFLSPEPARAVAEAARVLRPDGLVAAVAPLGWTTPDGSDVFETLPRDSRSPSDATTIETALGAEFALETGVWEDEVSADRLRDFHSIPAVAARLYPGLEADERVRAARDLLADVEGPLEQRWQWLLGRRT